MRHLLYFLTDSILPVGLIISVFYGFCADKIFWTDEDRENHFKGTYGCVKHVHQFWLNFIGSIVGWFSIYLFLNILLCIQFSELSLAHILLFGFGIIGIVGWLPMTLLGIATSLGGIAQKFLDFGKPK